MNRILRVLPAAGAIFTINRTAKCEALLEHTKFSEYIEPTSKVRFSAETLPIAFDFPAPLKLVSAGIRCMLGDSQRCDRPVTRVYSYGLYISPSVYDLSIIPDFDELVFNRKDIAKTLMLKVTVSKGRGHFWGGFNKTVGRRLRQLDRFHESQENRERSLQSKKKWCKLNRKFFKRDVPHGTIISVTWYDGKVFTEINGEKISEIDDDLLGEAIFKSYYGNGNVNPSVNNRTRAHYKHGIQDGEITEQEYLHEKGECPHYRECNRTQLAFW